MGPNTMLVSEKINEPIPRKLLERHKDRCKDERMEQQTLIHRTLPGTTGPSRHNQGSKKQTIKIFSEKDKRKKPFCNNSSEQLRSS